MQFRCQFLVCRLIASGENAEQCGESVSRAVSLSRVCRESQTGRSISLGSNGVRCQSNCPGLLIVKMQETRSCQWHDILDYALLHLWATTQEKALDSQRRICPDSSILQSGCPDGPWDDSSVTLALRARWMTIRGSPGSRGSQCFFN